MTDKLSWGIIGTGAIATTLANALAKSRTGTLAAVASRSQANADKFGDTFSLPSNKRYSNYQALLDDRDVSAIYIATPHPSHAEWAIKAVSAGKHALVEAALANNVLLMEAFMYRCHPQTQKLIDLLKEKAIGDVRVIQATFSF